MRRHISFIFLSIIMVACSSDNILSDEPATVVEYQYLEHNQWIYEQMNQNYLWRDDLPDSLDCNYGLTPPEFFKSILSPKDRFSYLTTNNTYNPNASQNYGFGFQEYCDKMGRKAIQILYVTSDKCKYAGVSRGDFYKIIFQNTSNIKMQKVYLDEEHCFYDTDKIITLPNSTTLSTVIKDTVIVKSQHTIGYLCYSEFEKESDLHNTLLSFQDSQITDLILDLRYNPGGYVSTCQYLCNCIVSDNGYGQIFQQCSYNTILSRFYFITTGNERTYSFFKSPAILDKPTLGVGIIALNLPKLYVLTSSHTASASEATIICLRPYMEVVVIGETTVGKGVGSRNFSSARFKYSIQPIIMRYYNATNETTPDSGIVPDYYVADGYSTVHKDLGNENEPLLKTALDIILGRTPSTMNRKSRTNKLDNSLTPIGDPSYITEFNNKHYNESN